MFSNNTIIIINARKIDFERFNEGLKIKTIFSEVFVKHFFRDEVFPEVSGQK